MENQKPKYSKKEYEKTFSRLWDIEMEMENFYPDLTPGSELEKAIEKLQKAIQVLVLELHRYYPDSYIFSSWVYDIQEEDLQS